MRNPGCRLVVVLTVLATAAGRSIDAQEAPSPVIRGRVVDTTGNAVAFARVTAGGESRVADDSGRFLLRVPRAGVVELTGRRVGFHPTELRLRIAKDTSVQLVMRALPASLAKVEVEAEATVVSLELAGFYDRLREKERATDTGHFILPEEIERQRGSVTQVVTGIPGLRVERVKTRGQNSSEYLGLFGNARQFSGNGLCPMTVYLDRIRLQPPGGALGRENPLPVDVNEVVSLRDVAGIEIYSRANTPFEFAMLNGTCGVVVIWTK
jgi:hypothetical protein